MRLAPIGLGSYGGRAVRERPVRIALAGALIGGVIAAAPARADPPPAPNSQTQPLVDGCQRSAAQLLTKRSPEWTYVYNTAADQPPPAPRWIAGTVSSGNPRYQAAHVSGGDLPTGHDAYDFNVNVLPDAGYGYLLSSANHLGNGEETNRLHTEWEDLTIPKFAWPEPGDHVMEYGSWVWDCGHWGTPTNVFTPDYILPQVGQPCPLLPGTFNPPSGPQPSDPNQCIASGESTEFHPYRALWDERAQSPNSPEAEREAELFVSTDKTKAGIEADCAHKFPPPATPGVRPVQYGPDYRLCLETEPDWQDVSGDYSFHLAAPAQPTPGAQLTYRAVRQGDSTDNAPPPTLTPSGDGIDVTFHLDSPRAQRQVMGYSIFVGWNVVPATSVPTHLRIKFDSLLVTRAMDPGCSAGLVPFPGCALESTRPNQLSAPPGDWNLYLDVNGEWLSWAPGNGEFLPNDGDLLRGDRAPRPVDLYVPPGQGWRLLALGRECDLNDVDPSNPERDCPTNHELADDNDVPGLILDSYPSAQASLGQHVSNGQTHAADPTSTCPDANLAGCYTLTYTVKQIPDDSSRVRR